MMSYVQRYLPSTFIALLAACLCIQFAFMPANLQVHASSGSPQAQAKCSAPCMGTFYGSNHSQMLTATRDWFQHSDYWCGISNIHAIQVYDWLYYNGGSPQWDNSQEAIYAQLNDASSISPWGYGGGYVKADISYDTGTDPRSIAYGAWYETPPTSDTNVNQSYLFHNWIYKTSATTATYDFSTDFGVNTVSHYDPISVTVDGGAHSFVVDGVYASGDPTVGSPTVYSIDTWDPWLNRSNQPRIAGIHYNQYQNQLWSMTDWTSNPTMWGQGYDVNNGSDPEPSQPPLTSNFYVPPFTYQGSPWYSHHWDTYYITIEQDQISTVDANYAIDENGDLAPSNQNP